MTKVTDKWLADAEWLEHAARYFEKRDTGGEDMAFWANVANAERCRYIAQSLRAQGGVRVEDQWRDLALQFDGHRIECLSMLRYVSEARTALDAANRVNEISAFLAKPTLPGEAVLAERIKALSSLEASPTAQAQTYPAAWMVRENERDTWDFVRLKKAADDLTERGFEVIPLYVEASPAPVSEEDEYEHPYSDGDQSGSHSGSRHKDNRHPAALAAKGGQ